MLIWGFLASAGACATIASDALMNPFDGMDTPMILKMDLKGR